MVYITMATTFWFNLYIFFFTTILWYVTYDTYKTSVVHPLQRLDGSALWRICISFWENFPKICFTLRWNPGSSKFRPIFTKRIFAGLDTHRRSTMFHQKELILQYFTCGFTWWFCTAFPIWRKPWRGSRSHSSLLLLADSLGSSC